MRVFKESDFTWCDSDLMVSDASYLGFPPGLIMRQFEIAGRGLFTYQGMAGDVFKYKNDAGLCAEVFND